MTARPVLATPLGQAREAAALANSIAERADAMAERIGTSPFGRSGASPEAQNERAAFRRQAGYAEGVRDVLLWLTGQPPAAMLTDVLDIDPEEGDARAKRDARYAEITAAHGMQAVERDEEYQRLCRLVEEEED